MFKENFEKLLKWQYERLPTPCETTESAIELQSHKKFVGRVLLRLLFRALGPRYLWLSAFATGLLQQPPYAKDQQHQ